jgi:AcrR family transcriptional regulator
MARWLDNVLHSERAARSDSGEMAPRGRGRPRDPGADAAILRAAFELFIERGVEGASIEQIAKRAGVGKLTVYRRWSSKEDLLVLAIEAVIQERDWPSDEEIATGTPYEIIEQVLPAAAQMAASPQFRALVARVFGSSVSHPRLMETYWRHYILPRRIATKTLLQHAPSRRAPCPRTPTSTCSSI